MSDEATLTELETRQLTTLEEIASIKEQIARAKALAMGEGKYADADWYQSANRALRHKQIEHQALLQSAAKLRKKMKTASNEDRQSRFEPAFIAAARGILDGDTYERIVQRANESIA